MTESTEQTETPIVHNLGVALDGLQYLWGRKKSLLKTFFITGGLLAALSLLLPNYFSSTVSLLPGTAEGSSSMLSSLSTFASLAGVNVGSSSIEALYPAIIQSEAILGDVIRHKYVVDSSQAPIDLVEYWDPWVFDANEKYDRVLDKLRKELDITVDQQTYVVTISLRTKYPLLSAAVVNRIARNLDAFIRTKRTTNASEERKWIETRLQQVEAALRGSEDSLKAFNDRNRRVEDSPELQIARERLMRDVEINSTLFVELKKQLELAIIEEIKTVPVVTIMDAGRAAAVKVSPKRSVLVSSLEFLIMSAYVGLLLVKRYNTVQYEIISARLRTFLKSLRPSRLKSTPSPS